MILCRISGELRVLGRNEAVKLMLLQRYTKRRLFPRLRERLLAIRRIWARNGKTSHETNGNRVSPTRTAQRRVDDLTNTGALWKPVEAWRKFGR